LNLFYRKLELIRHGENKANITREFSCKTVDYPLTEKGKIQAKQTAEALANLKMDKIVSSPLLRAKQTAEAIYWSYRDIPKWNRSFMRIR
jgi:broad specificity phosphatase PhoE